MGKRNKACPVRKNDCIGVSRHDGTNTNYTPLELFKKISESFQQKQFSNVYVIVNDINKTNSHSYGYGYYYGKGYTYNKKRINNKIKKYFKKMMHFTIKNLL